MAANPAPPAIMTTRTTTLRAFAASTFAVCLAGSLSAATLTLGPTHDATIRSDQTGVNTNTNLLLVGDAGTANLRSLLSFDLSNPDLVGATINSVTLTLTLNDGSENDGAGNESAGGLLTINLNLLDSAFTESGVTWNTTNGSTAWTTAGGAFSTLLSSASGDLDVATTGSTFNFASSGDFVSAVTTSVGGTGILNLMVKLNDETATNRNVFRFTSSEPNAVPAGYAPVLTIDYTAAVIPEPSAFAALGGLAAIGFAGGRRRRR